MGGGLVTFLVGFATPTLALLAGDTRSVLRTVEDELAPEPARGPALQRDNKIKLRPLPAGWMTGGSTSAWTDGLAVSLAQAPGDRESLRAQARDFAPTAMAEILDFSPALGRRIQQEQATFVIGADARGLFRLHMNWRGDDCCPGERNDQVFGLVPKHLPLALHVRLLGKYQQLVRRRVGATTMWQATIALYRAMYKAGGPAGSVSAFVCAGLLAQSGGRVQLGAVGPVCHTPAALSPATREALHA